MITQERDERAGARLLLWAFLASIVIHALVLPIAFWQWSRSVLLSVRPAQREWVVSSAAIRIERREVPQPPAMPQRSAAQPVRPQPQSHAAAAIAPAEAAPRPELFRAAPTAPPQPRKRTEHKQPASLEQQLAQQQVAFSQAVARLRAQDSPLSIAPERREAPSTYRRTYFDVPGHAHREQVQALLIPLRHWIAGSMSCYYVRYLAQFTSGGSEDGVIPWPVCYPATDDSMANPPYPHDLPMPVPQRDYVLPPGTYLTPLLKSIYDRRG